MTARLHELFEAQVARTPDATALIVEDRRLSYRELNGLANALARRLVEAGVRPGALVGVCLRRDERLVAGLLAVFKAGAAYVPLDPAYPAPRLAFLASDAGLAHVLVAKEHHDLVTQAGAEPVPVDELTPEPTNLDVPGTAADAAYVVYTSGSTGTPKGIVVEHASAVNLVTWGVATWSAHELTGNLSAASVAFDFSVTELYPTLVSGGTVILAGTLLDLPTLPARDEVTMVSGPPSALRALLHHGLPPGVRTVNSGGEALPASLLDALFAQPGVRRVRNLYGPSECTTLSHAWDLSEANGTTPPIGIPVAGAVGLVLDDGGNPVEDGEIGELWIAGAGVARGYLNRPELTAQRFVADPSVAGGRRYRTGDLVRRVDGVYHYEGRVDDQVKVRGFRVELGEVEQALTALPPVRAAVVTAPADPDGVRGLVAYVELIPGTAATEASLKQQLGERVPGYLVPSRIGVLDALPLAPSGKVDRAALPPLWTVDPGVEYVAPRDGVEERIATAVAEVLGLPRIGVHDGFFDLGGDSLGAATVVARLGRELGVTVPLSAFLTAPTVAGLAAALPKSTVDGPVRAAGATESPLLGSQWFMWMLPRMFPGATNTAGVCLRVHGPTDVAPIQRALDGVVRRHEVLRTVVEERGGMPVAVVAPPVPVPVDEVHGAADRLDEIVAEAGRYRFDLATSVPLLRATVVWTGPAEAVVILVVDHFAIDGYSIAVIVDELTDLLAGQPLAEPALQLGDLARWEMTAAGTADPDPLRAFWRTELDGAHSPNLPGALRTKGPVTGRRLAHRLDANRIEALRTACGVTRFAVFAAALGILLRHRTGHDENLLGVISALRDRPAVEGVVGPLDGMVPLRLSVTGDPGFRTLSARVADRTRMSLAHQDLGIDGIMKLQPDRHPGDPLLPVFLSMQPASVPVTVVRQGIRVELLGEVDTGGIFSDLIVLVNETVDGPELLVGYDVERFSADDAQLFLDQLLLVLDAAAADPDRPVSGYLFA